MVHYNYKQNKSIVENVAITATITATTTTATTSAAAAATTNLKRFEM